MLRKLHMTNGTKALLIACANADMALALAFGLPLSEVQLGAIAAAVNAFLSLWVGITRNGPKAR